MRAVKSKNVWLLSMAQGLHVAVAMTAVAVVSLVGAQFAPEPGLATVPNAMLTVGVALSTIPLSFFMKRFSRRTGFFLGAGFGLLSFSTGIVGVFEASFWMICLASLLQGVYQASFLYYRFAAAESVGEERQKSIAISLVLAGALMAVVLAPMGVKAMNLAFLPTQYVGAYVFMLMLAGAAFIPLYFLRLPPRRPEDDHGAERPLSAIFRQPRAVAALATNMAAWASMVLLMSATPLAMKHAGHGFDASTGVIQMHVLGMYAPSLFSGYLISRLGVSKILFAGLGCLGLTVWFASQGYSVHHFSAALVALGVSWNFLFVGGTTLLTRCHTPAERAKVQGLNEFAGFGISAVAAASAGALLNAGGWNALLMVNVTIMVVVFVICLWYVLGDRRQNNKMNMETYD